MFFALFTTLCKNVKNPLHRKSAFFFVARLVLYVFVWKKNHVEKCLSEWMEKYCGSRYKFHFRKNRRRKRASLRSPRGEFLYVYSRSRGRTWKRRNSKSDKVSRDFGWKKKMTLFALTTKVVEEFSDFRSWIREKAESSKTTEIGEAIGLSLRSLEVLCLVLPTFVALRVQYTANKNVGCFNVLFRFRWAYESIVRSKFQSVHGRRCIM